MKRILPVLVILSFILPPVSFAAGLTSQQSISLIAVVQSSPGTPASVFVPLITAFSNITVNQATSLITVVQAAPNVPASAFINLLTSFTEDTPIVQPAMSTTTQPMIPQTTQSTIPATSPIATMQPTQTNQQTTQPAPAPIPVITPPPSVVQTPPTPAAVQDTTPPKITWIDINPVYVGDWVITHPLDPTPDHVQLRVSSNEPLDLSKTEFYLATHDMSITDVQNITQYNGSVTQSYGCHPTTQQQSDDSCMLYTTQLPITLSNVKGGPTPNTVPSGYYYEANITDPMTLTSYITTTQNCAFVDNHCDLTQSLQFKVKLFDLAGNSALTRAYRIKIAPLYSSGKVSQIGYFVN